MSFHTQTPCREGNLDFLWGSVLGWLAALARTSNSLSAKVGWLCLSRGNRYPRSRLLRRGVLLNGLSGLVVWVATESAWASESPDVGVITNIVRRVDVARFGAPDRWDRATTETPYSALKPGDQVRTLPNSMATIFLYPFGTREKPELMTMGPNSRLQLPIANEKPKFLAGLWHFFGRTTSESWEFQTETVFGSVKNTDFILEVKENGGVTVRVAQGTVEVSNRSNATNVLTLSNGQGGRYDPATGTLEPLKPLALGVTNLAQTFLYYPGVLYLGDLNLGTAFTGDVGDSLRAYAEGDLPRALSVYPTNRPPASNDEKLFYASLVVVAGQYPEAEATVQGLSRSDPEFARQQRLGNAIREVMASAQGMDFVRTEAPQLESEWLAESYYQQSRAGRSYTPVHWDEPYYSRRSTGLERALAAAKQATPDGSTNGFGWVRRAELEFSFGRTREAVAALARAGAQTNFNAEALTLRGYLCWAENDYRGALEWFKKARDRDPRLGNAWLGLGLTEIHNENLFEFIRRGAPLDYWRARPESQGLSSLEAAAAAEPNRSLLRSYLGKGYYEAGGLWGPATDLLLTNAFQQLDLARRLDPLDPTPDLYSALIKKEQHRINESVEDLQRSVQLNDNRQAFRSTFLLDQDASVRSVNLANIYRQAGMPEVALQEAVKGVSYDYANYSSHLFISDSFATLRDPTRFNLRYETVWFNELLLANILAPVGAGRLSQAVSAQEYSRLFVQDGLGLASWTQVRSDGMFQQRASQFGTIGDTEYALDLDYRHNDGVRPNNELESIEWYSTIKQRVTAEDTALLLVKYQDYHSGDNFQYYDPDAPGVVRENFSFDEQQDPILVGAWNHEWSPGMNTLFLGGRLVNKQQFSDLKAPVDELIYIGGQPFDRRSPRYDIDYRNSLVIYTAELNQLCNWNRITLSAGTRFQSGPIQTENTFKYPSSTNSPVPVTDVEANFDRITGYGYLTVEPVDNLWLTAGLAYDVETIPQNFRHPPVISGDEQRSLLGPKAAFVWTLLPQATFRGIYSQSLGGVSLDQSYRLEPTQLAGFPQAFRSLIPESLVGSVAAPTYKTFGLALDLKFASKTFAGIQADRLTTKIEQQVGMFYRNGYAIDAPTDTTSVREEMGYQENAVAFNINQIIGQRFVAGARFRWADVLLERSFPDLQLRRGNPFPQDSNQQGVLYKATGLLLYQHPTGVFLQADVNWYGQSYSTSSGELPSESFVQTNLYIGYRLPRDHGLVRVGLLNLTDQDFRLSPLTAYTELPRDRVIEVTFGVQF